MAECPAVNRVIQVRLLTSVPMRGCSSPVERRSPKPRQSGFNSCLPRQSSPESVGEREQTSSKLFSCMFADNVDRLFVGAQSKKGRMPHLAVTRPLGEFYLAHELRNEPRGLILVLHLFIEGLLAGVQRLHRSIDRFQRDLVEAGADMPSVDPALLRFVAHCKHQGAEVLSRPARLSVTDYHHLLLMYGLELEPLARSLARVIQPRRALGDHALFVR